MLCELGKEMKLEMHLVDVPRNIIQFSDVWNTVVEPDVGTGWL